MKLKLLQNTLVATLAIVAWNLTTGTSHAQVVVSPPNYKITTPNNQFSFVVNGQSATAPSGQNNSFAFSLNAGVTYIFEMNTALSFHPVNICTGPTIGAVYSGDSMQSASGDTIIKLTLPATNYPTTLYYICSVHGFYGVITVNPPQPPPAATILSTTVSTNIMLTFSGGTNTVPMVPQFSSNLVSGAWLPVPSYTNTYSGNGTNTTSFNRLDAICGPNVYLRISQVPN